MSQGHILGIIMRVNDDEVVSEILNYLSRKAKLIYVKTTSPDYILLVKKIPKKVWKSEPQIK